MKNLLYIVGFVLVLLFVDCDGDCTVTYTDFETTPLNFNLELPYNVQGTISKDSLGFFIAMTGKMVEKHGNCYQTLYTNPVTNLTIKTLYDYSDTFPAGSDITDLFKQQGYTSSGTYNFIPIDEYIAILSKHNMGNTTFYLQLMDTTSKGGIQKFEISITLSDGTMLTHQTNDVVLK